MEGLATLRGFLKNQVTPVLNGEKQGMWRDERQHTDFNGRTVFLMADGRENLRHLSSPFLNLTVNEVLVVVHIRNLNVRISGQEAVVKL